MLRLAADENFNGRVLRALRRRIPNLDVARVQDVLPEGTDDPTLLEWAALEERVVLSHDAATMVGYAHARIAEGEPMPGLIIVLSRAAIGTVVDDLELVLGVLGPEDVREIVTFVPL